MPSLALADILRTMLSGREELLLPQIEDLHTDVRTFNIADKIFMSRHRPEVTANQGNLGGKRLYPTGTHPVAPGTGGEWLGFWSALGSSFTLNVRSRIEVEINNFYDESNNPITSVQSRTRAQTLFPLAVPQAGTIEEWKQQSAFYPVQVVEGKSLAMLPKVENYTSDGPGTARAKEFMALFLSMEGLSAQYLWDSTSTGGPSDPNLIQVPSDGSWHDGDTLVYTPPQPWSGTKRLLIGYSWEAYTNPGVTGNQMQFQLLGPGDTQLRYSQIYDDITNHSPLWSKAEFVIRGYTYSPTLTFRTQYKSVTTTAAYRRRAIFVADADVFYNW